MDKWVRGLPADGDVGLVSLLGQKRDGLNEFSFYSFCGGFDNPEARRGRPTLQQWLDRKHKEHNIVVVEHPSIDFCRLPQETMCAAEVDIKRMLSEGDSGGETRTKEVCKHAGFVEDTQS